MTGFTPETEACLACHPSQKDVEPMTDKAVDEAVERVRELIVCIRSNAEENNAHLNDKWVTTIHAHTTVLLEDLLPDLQALLSALELGRQAQQSPAGLGLHPLRSDLAEALRLVDSVHLGLSLAASQPVPMPEGGFRCTLHPTRANASVECLEKAIALLKAALSPTTPQGGES